jgi:hypothetical protein
MLKNEGVYCSVGLRESRGCLVIYDKKELDGSFSGFLINSDGALRKYECGVYHRENDQPARVTKGGAMIWYIDGKMRRDYGLPCLITDSGERVWFSESSDGHMNKDRTISLEALNGALVIGFKEIVE